ncbi:hypothetical protein DB30_06933 [Enhygromyxa salina]|uniref:Uncharacterized protein n=2 Tax=Enhygromyxa salina TaxID=215803 RepID=A0A0C2CT40_9BACT|nr:hypothetical protein DB30_06933 [Enhygromyxa salina]
MYIIIARTDAFVVDKRARVVVVPKSHVRRPSCVLESVNDPNNHVDWMRLKLAGARTGPWTEGLELAEPVTKNQRLTASFHPLGLPAKFSERTPVGVRGSVYSLKIDSAEGCSGGGLIDDSGRLAGVVSGRVPRHTWFETLKFNGPLCIEARTDRSEQFTPIQSIVFTKQECTDTRTKENQDHADTSHDHL